ncbi:hypothetical protein SK128_016279 [Halocaridina rubra]|uniref:Uncharacterized protein n=1 Tax=Halocaridina rubra TaxID=373956 RepID=A0AAN8W916_HALRR
MDQASALYLDDECKGVMGNRDLYEYLAKVCDDCANVYRSHELGQKCRQECFFNKDFVQCALSIERRAEMENLNRAMSIIRAGRK